MPVVVSGVAYLFTIKYLIFVLPFFFKASPLISIILVFHFHVHLVIHEAMGRMYLGHYIFPPLLKHHTYT